MNHIDEQQWNAWLAERQGEDSPLNSHLRSCDACRAEGDRLRSMVAEFSKAAHSEGTQAETFWTRQRAQVLQRLEEHQSPTWTLRWRWAVPMPIAVLGVIVALVLSNNPTRKSVPAQSNDAMDEALLLQVQYDTYRQVPSALEPAGLLVQERNRVLTSKKSQAK
jgi:anti-sigma factor RsiW